MGLRLVDAISPLLLSFLGVEYDTGYQEKLFCLLHLTRLASQKVFRYLSLLFSVQYSHQTSPRECMYAIKSDGSHMVVIL